MLNLQKTVLELRSELSDGHIQQLCTELADSREKSDSLNKILHAHRRRYQSEALYADGRVIDAAQLLLEIIATVSDDVKADTVIMDWVSGEFHHPELDVLVQPLLLGFSRKCVITLENLGDDASKVGNHDEALAAYSTALSLDLSTPNCLLTKWASTMLLRVSAHEVLDVATTKACFSSPSIVDADKPFLSGRVSEVHCLLRALRYSRRGRPYHRGN